MMRRMRRLFLLGLGHGIRIVWPVLSGILLWQLVFGMLVTWHERAGLSVTGYISRSSRG